MDKVLKLLVIEKDAALKDERLGSRIDRSKTLTALTSMGGKVRHDSGGRLIIIETSKKAEKELSKRMTGVRLVPLDSDVKDIISDLDPNEQLFLEALKIRNSKSFRDAKKKRKFGETAEEKELTSAPCIREEY